MKEFKELLQDSERLKHLVYSRLTFIAIDIKLNDIKLDDIKAVTTFCLN